MTSDHSHLERLPDHPNVVINAPPQLIGADLVINGSSQQKLWPDTIIDRSGSRFFRRLFGVSTPSPSAAKAYLELPPGRHILTVSQRGYRPIIKTIELLRDQRQEVRITHADLIEDIEEKSVDGNVP